MVELELVPLKITLKMGPNGIEYPDFNQIPLILRRNLDWRKYIDFNGGWHYDKEDGFGKADAYNSDHTTWSGMILVDQPFAQQAVALFPEQVTELDETDFIHYYEKRAHRREIAERIDANILMGLRAKYGIDGAIKSHHIADMTDEEKDMLDPESDTPGITQNKNKTAAGYLAKRGVKIRRRQ